MRLTDFEPLRLDELAPATLASYKTKAGAAATAADAAGDRKTADKRFSGIVKATKKQFDQDAKGVSEDSDDTVRFEVDSENAYNHVMDQFGSVIDWDGDTMVAPRKYWGAIQELALAASGEASEEQGVAEGFDQPYSLKWEKSDYGDVDALAKLPDGSPLSIMFNLADMSENDWGVEFYRNNSQSVTGEGDAQRIFATVLTAIGKFVKKKKPDTLFFSTVKEEDPTGSRAKLYDRLVQRYATGLGYDLKKVEYPEQTGYKLTRKEQGVAEGSAADGSVNYTLGHTPDAEYVYHIYRDGKKEGTYHSVDQAREIMGNMMLTRPNREYKIKRGTRNKMAGPTGQLPEAQGRGVSEDALAGMKRLAGIASAQTPTTPGQRQYRHMPTAVQPR